MILLTGDIHGDVRTALWAMQKHEMTKDDTLILFGDVGLNYYGADQGDYKRKKLLNKAGIPVFCIHGNHEERPFNIPSYHEMIWHGGTVYIEDDFPNLLFAKDGEIFDLDGKKCVVIGGAYSVDKYYRLQNNWNWFPDEQPSEEIKRRTENNLAACGWKVDVVLSHTCPQKYVPVEAFMPGLDQSLVDHSTDDWLDTIEERLQYQSWYCGHWHIDKHIDRLHFMMHSVEAL